MKNGGYKIIDLKDLSLSASGVTVAGVYKAIAGTRKAVLVSGINFGGTYHQDAFVQPNVTSSSVTFSIFGKTVTITSSDVITIA